MTTIDSSNYASGFTGLYQNAGIALCIAGLCTIGHDLLSRTHNVTPQQATDIRFRQGIPKDESDSSMDDYTMGYLYRARCFVPSNPAPPLSRWPLVWIWESICRPETYYLKRIGLDGTTYVRFLRACFYSVLIFTITITTVLLPIHLHYAPSTIPEDSISRASISALVQNSDAKSLLWIHVVLLWWMSLVWCLAMTWVGLGVVRHRRNMVRSLLRQGTQSQSPFLKPASDDLHRGWFYRTLIIGNLHHTMLSETKLKSYLALRLQEPNSNLKTAASVRRAVPLGKKIPLSVFPLQRRSDLSVDISTKDKTENELISEVLLIRRSVQLYSAYTKRDECLRDLETAHILLAKNVLAHAKKMVKKSKTEDDVVSSLEPFLDADPKDRNLWITLSQTPPEQLDKFQPRTRISPLWKFWKRQHVSTIDYKLARLNLLSKLVEDLRVKDPSSKPSAVAFITFSSPSLATKAKRLIERDKNFGPLCFCHRAPETRDINWKRIIKADRTASLVREPIVYVSIWALTIFWLIPLSLLVGIFSLNNIGKLVPGIARLLDNHPQARAAISNLLPTILVNIIMFLVPTMITQLSLRGQNIFTMTRLHKLVMSRYWKFLAINVLIFFCIATTALQTFLSIFRSSGVHFNPLVVTASAFPSSAVFYVSWILLVCGVHNFFELVLFGIALINHSIIRKVVTPRKRHDLAVPRSFSYFSYIPMHLLVVAVTLVFSLLNPVIMAFSLAYFSFAIVVFKNQFTRVYWRRYYELNGNLIYRRFMRYSLDTLVIAQVVIMALMFVSKFSSYGSACIPTIIFTIIYKLALTRWFYAHMKFLDKEEAEIICDYQTRGQQDDLVERQDDFDDNEKESNCETSSKTLKSRIYNILMFIPRRVTKILPPVISVRETEDSYARIDDPWRFRKLSNKISSPQHHTPSSSEPSTEMKTTAIVIDNDKEVQETEGSEFSSLIKLHSRLVRDDRPDPSASYENPCLIKPLDYKLWLPRNPYTRLHLDDTVDYFGRILVSSEGGDGIIVRFDTEKSATENQDRVIENSSKPSTSNIKVLLAAPPATVSEDAEKIERDEIEQISNKSYSPSVPSTAAMNTQLDNLFTSTMPPRSSGYQSRVETQRNDSSKRRSITVDVKAYAEQEVLKESTKLQQEEEEYLGKNTRYNE